MNQKVGTGFVPGVTSASCHPANPERSSSAVTPAASATDPEIAARWPPGEDPRHTVQRAAAEALTAKPDAHPDLDTARAADLLFGLLSPELYLVLVRDRGWTPDIWEERARTTLTAQLTRGGPPLTPPAR